MKKGIIVTAFGGVIAGFFLNFREMIILLVMELLNFTLQIIYYIWDIMLSSHLVPGLLLLTLGVFAIAGLAGICVLLYALVRSKPDPEFMKYTEDFIHTAKWRWSWDNNRISDLWCFCPVCDAQLVPVELFDETQFICEQCTPEWSGYPYDSNWKVVAKIRGGNMHYSLGVVEREILRRIRTGVHQR